MDLYQNQNQWGDEGYYGSISDMVPSEEPEAVRSAGWRVLAVLFMLLGVGGLFLGMLSKVVAAFTPVGAFTEYGGYAALEGSLAGYMIAYVKTLATQFSALFSGGMANILTNTVQLLLVAALAVTAIVSIITFIVALASGRRAKKAAVTSGVLVFLTYAGLFLWSYFLESRAATLFLATKPALGICDIPTATVAAAALLLLCIGAVASKGRLFTNVIMLIVPLLAAFLFS